MATGSSCSIRSIPKDETYLERYFAEQGAASTFDVIQTIDGRDVADAIELENYLTAKTHAGHRTTRTRTATGTPHTTEWTTPTGHTYTTPDDPFPVENWPQAGERTIPDPVLDEPDNRPPE